MGRAAAWETEDPPMRSNARHLQEELEDDDDDEEEEEQAGTEMRISCPSSGTDGCDAGPLEEEKEGRGG